MEARQKARDWGEAVGTGGSKERFGRGEEGKRGGSGVSVRVRVRVKGRGVCQQGLDSASIGRVRGARRGRMALQAEEKAERHGRF